VDDEVELIESYLGYLKRKLPDGHFELATSGKDALEIFKSSGQFDLIITDVRMQNGDGPFLLGEINKLEPNPKPFFVFFTGYSEATQEELIKLGASAILEKPISMKKLWETVKEGLNIKS